jgi:hypothetical protein
VKQKVNDPHQFHESTSVIMMSIVASTQWPLLLLASAMDAEMGRAPATAFAIARSARQNERERGDAPGEERPPSGKPSSKAMEDGPVVPAPGGWLQFCRVNPADPSCRLGARSSKMPRPMPSPMS